MHRFAALLAAVLLAACGAAGNEETPAALNGRVRDFAGILDPSTEAHLTRRLDEAELRYGPQVGIVTVASLDGRTIEDFSLDYAREWKLGHAHRDDGLMILIAPNERKVRIEVGYGLEGSFDDAFCKEVIDRTMLPQFRQQNYARGLAGALDMMIAKMRAVPTVPANDNAPLKVKDAA